ncbi:MAG: kelch repeat-containing protein [Elusimicrobiota bacterium]|jgi:N-acetylneuraminic acid mutarotase
MTATLAVQAIPAWAATEVAVGQKGSIVLPIHLDADAAALPDGVGVSITAPSALTLFTPTTRDTGPLEPGQTVFLSTDYEVAQGATPGTFSVSFNLDTHGADISVISGVPQQGASFQVLSGEPLGQDTTPPQTTVSYGAPTAAAAGGIYLSPLSHLTLNSSDPAPAGQTSAGVAGTYSLVDTVFVDHATTPGQPYYASFALAAGVHSLYGYSIDLAGNIEQPAAQTVYVDGTAPASHLEVSGSTGPVSGPLLLSSTQAVALLAADPELVAGSVAGAGVKEIRFFLNVTAAECAGTPYSPLAAPGSCANPVYNGAFAVAPGSHTLQWYALDRVGNEESLHSAQLAVEARDEQAPVTTLALGGPSFTSTAGTLYVSSWTSISLAAADASTASVQSGVRSTEYSLDGAPSQEYTTPFALLEGAHIVRYRSIDNAGNVESTHTLTLAADASAPQLSFVPDPAGRIAENGAIYTVPGATVTASAVDPVSGGVTSGLAWLRGSIDGGLVVESTTSLPLSFTFTEGAHALALSAEDGITNSAQAVHTVYADGSAPVTTLSVLGGYGVDPEGRRVFSSTSPVFLDASDAVSGVERTYFLVNHTPEECGFGDGEPVVYSTMPAGSCQNPVYTSSFTLSAGAYALRYMSVDLLGNAETMKVSSLTVTEPYATPVDPTVASITPNTGYDNGSVNVTVNGSDFQPGATLAIRRGDPSGSGSWSTTAGLHTPRDLHSVVKLPNGQVLVCGGTGPDGASISSCELYNLLTGSWTITGAMSIPRASFALTVLPNGNVLATGGNNIQNFTSSYLASAEIYSPATGLWAPAPAMAESRSLHAAILMSDGRVLVTGGVASNGADVFYRGSEVYTPVTDSWSSVAPMPSLRSHHTINHLLDGRILVVGGWMQGGDAGGAIVYSPTNDQWAPTGTMQSPRAMHTATLLSNGKVLVAGGDYGVYQGLCEIFDPATNLWTATNSLAGSRTSHAAVALTSGKVLVSGGLEAGSDSTAELYDPAAGTWSSIGVLDSFRVRHSAITLSDGRVLLAGGAGYGGYSTVSALYAPASVNVNAGAVNVLDYNRMSGQLDLTNQPIGAWDVVVTNPDGRSGKLAQGFTVQHAAPPAVVTDLAISAVNMPLATLSWTVPEGAVAYELRWATYALNAGNLASGTPISVVPGTAGTTQTADVDVAVATRLYAALRSRSESGLWSELSNIAQAYLTTVTVASIQPNSGYDTGPISVSVHGTGFESDSRLMLTRAGEGSSGTWNSAGISGIAHGANPIAIRLADGRVLFAGGQNGGTTSELYDQARGTWTATGAMNTARTNSASILLDDGRVLVVGGMDLASAEIYDPATGLWSAASSMSTVRSHPAIALLPDGKVLIAGGWNWGGNLQTTETYDPVGGSWTSSSDMHSAHPNATAARLTGGKILVIGGEGAPEVFDPVSQTWTPTGSMAQAHNSVYGIAALTDGRVLISGGPNSNAVEIYDPASNLWMPARSMDLVRTYGHSATTLPDGKVLVAGGYSGPANIGLLSDAEIYDPVSDTWALAGTFSRALHAATLLSDGRVLLAGGFSAAWVDAGSDLYTPATQTIEAVNLSAAGPTQMAGTLDLTGKPAGAWDVVVTNADARSGKLAQGFTVQHAAPPAAVTDLAISAIYPSSVTLAWSAPADVDGHELRYASYALNAVNFADASLAAPTGTSYTVENLTEPGFYAAVRAHGNSGLWSEYGNVVGLARSTVTVNGAPELAFSGNQPVTSVLLSVAEGTGAVVLATANAQGLVAVSSIYELGPENTTFTPPAVLTFRYSPEALIALGLTPADIAIYHYDSVAGQMELVAGQNQDEAAHTVTAPISSLTSIYGLLGTPVNASPELDVLAPRTNLYLGAGGVYGETNYASTSTLIGFEVVDDSRTVGDLAGVGVAYTSYTVDAGDYVGFASSFTIAEGTHTLSFFSVDLLGNAEVAHSTTVVVTPAAAPPVSPTVASILPNSGYDNGSVNVTVNGSDFQNGAALELARGDASSTATWTTAASPVTTRYYHSSVRLKDGRILVCGGIRSDQQAIADTEIYDPASGTWATTGAMSTPRSRHTATLLPDGKVLVAGGDNPSMMMPGMPMPVFQASAELYDPVAGTWTPTGAMANSRAYHSATTLGDDKVLVVGGYSNGAELYDPASGVWSPAPSMEEPHSGHTATLLGDGKILIAGGWGNSGPVGALILDLSAGTWTPTAAMANPRIDHVAVLLGDGKVLVAGGDYGTYAGGAEIYDPGTGLWSATAGMSRYRARHSAAALPDGRVLVAWGTDTMGSPTNSAEIYDPAAASWSDAGSYGNGGSGHSTVRLSDGRVMLTGGYGVNGFATEAVLYGAPRLSIPATAVSVAGPTQLSGTLDLTGKPLGAWDVIVTNTDGRSGALAQGFAIQHAAPPAVVTDLAVSVVNPPLATLSWTVPSGAVAYELRWATYTLNAANFASGTSISAVPGTAGMTQTADVDVAVATRLYAALRSRSESGLWSELSNIAQAYLTTVTVASIQPNSGYDTGPISVSVHGTGFESDSILALVRGDGSSTATWTTETPPSTARYHHASVRLNDGRILLCGGRRTDQRAMPDAELYDPASGTWATTGAMNTPRANHTATLLSDGKVLVAGGDNPGMMMPGMPMPVYQASAEIFDPAAGTWTPTGTMTSPRAYHTTTPLADGKILVVGGGNSGAELYDPAAGTWSAAPSMPEARTGHTATLLGNGKILVVGGSLGGGLLLDLSAGTWTPTSAMVSSRIDHAAVLLGDGKVLVAGGDYGTYAGGAEIYDPVTGLWTATAGMSRYRARHSAAVLPDGRVLVAWGTEGNVTPTNISEIYDPKTASWTDAGSFGNGGIGHSAVRLLDGRVMLTGAGYGVSGFVNETVFYGAPSLSIPATVVNVAGPTQLSGTLDLTGKPLGAWDVVVTNLDGRSGKLAQGFTINAVNAAPELDVLAPRTQLILGAGGVYGETNYASTSTLIGFDVVDDSRTVGDLAGVGVAYTSYTVDGAEFLAYTSSFTLAAGTHTLAYFSVDRLGNAEVAHSTTVVVTPCAASVDPMVASITPNSGRNNDAVSVVVDGENFQPGATLSISKGDPSSLPSWMTGTSIPTARAYHASVRLPDGKIFVCGGMTTAGVTTDTAELYDPVAKEWAPVPSMSTTRLFHTATLLRNGKVLVVGGSSPPSALSSVEMFDPIARTWSPVATMHTARSGHEAVLLADGRLVVVGGADSNGIPLSGVESYDTQAGGWTEMANMPSPRMSFAATLLADGKRLLITGGMDAGYQKSADAFILDSTNGTWSQTGSMTIPRKVHRGALLTNGKVLVTGGNGTEADQTELYDPATGAWVAAAPMYAGRGDHVMTVLPSGKVLVVGGQDHRSMPMPNYPTLAEIFDPLTGTWIDAGALSAGRSWLTSVRQSDGKIMVVGGLNEYGAMTNVDEFIPPDYTRLLASGTTSEGTTRIFGMLELTNQSAGVWDVIVANPDGRSGTLAGGFTINAVVATPELDVLAPRTQLILGAGGVYGETNYASTSTLIGFDVVDDSRTVGDLAGVGVAYTSYTVDAGEYLAFTSSFTLAAGTHTLSFFSVDRLGNAEVVKSSPIVVDGQAPTIAWSIEDGDMLVRHDLVQATFSDPEVLAGVAGSGVQAPQVQVFLDGTDLSDRVQYSEGNAMWTWSIPKGFPVGSHHLLARAWDRAGNAAESETHFYHTLLTVADASTNTVTLQWLEPPYVESYEIRWATYPFRADFPSGTLTTAPAPTGAGTEHFLTLEGIDAPSVYVIGKVTRFSRTDKYSNTVTVVRSETLVDGRPDGMLQADWPVTMSELALDGGAGSEFLAAATAQGLTRLGGIYEPGPPGERLDPAARMKFAYSPAALAALGMSPADAAVYQFIAGSGLVPVEPQSVQESSRTYTVWLSSFTSAYGLFGFVHALPDVLAPRTSIVLGAGGLAGGVNYVNAATPISFSVEDDSRTAGDLAGVGVAYSSYSIDGGEYLSYMTPFTLPAGEHSVRYLSADLAGNVEPPHNASFIADAQGPQITITSPAAGAYVTTALPEIHAEVVDSGSGVATDTIRMLLDDVQVPAALQMPSGLGAWDSAGTMPEAMRGVASVRYMDRIYVLGGVSDPVPMIASVRHAQMGADGRIGAWTETTPLPEGVSLPAVALLGNRIYVAGGHAASGIMSTAYYADIQGDGSVSAWQPAGQLPYADGVGYNGLVAVGEHLYFVGGERPGCILSSQVFYAKACPAGLCHPVDGNSSAPWAATASLPQGLNLPGTAARRDWLYITGGNLNGCGANRTDSTYRAHVQSDGTLSAWEQLADRNLPAAVAGHEVFVSGDRLYSMGGETYATGSEIQDVWSSALGEDGSMGPWRSETQLPERNAYMSAVEYGGRLWMAGGFSPDGQNKDAVLSSVLLAGKTLLSYVPATALPGGLHRVRVSAQDRVGNASEAESDFTVPNFVSLTPSSGPIGIPFTLSGSGFGAYAGANTRVKFGSLSAPVSVWNDTTISGTVPGLPPGTYAVAVERQHASSMSATNAGNFIVLAPAAAAMTPSSAPIGTPFTLAGTAFGPYNGANTVVLFNGTTAPLSVWNDTTITGTVPGVAPGAAAVTVVRRTADGGFVESAPLAFEIVVPVIASVTPSSGPIGVGFSLTGTGFGPYNGANTLVLMGGATAALSVWNDALISGTVPGALAPGLHPVVVRRVTADGGVSESASAFFAVEGLSVASLSPSSAPIGTPFTIAGADFGPYDGANTRVLFGTVSAPLSLWNDAAIMGTVPGLAVGSYDVVVERRQGTSTSSTSAGTFTVLQPAVASVTPSSGPIGVAFTLTGSAFGPYNGANTVVLMGGATAPLSVWNDTTITGTVPGVLTAGTYALVVRRVTADGGSSESSGASFHVTGPSIAALTPSSGPIGVPFTLTGTDFGTYNGANTRVKFGETVAALSLWNDTTIAGTVPGLSAGTWEVVVERQQGADVVRSASAAFTVLVPGIASVTPSSAPIGAPFTIKGAGFGLYAGANTRVRVGGLLAPLSLWNDTTITGTLPAASTGTQPLVIERVTGATLATSDTFYFEILAPVVASLTPSSAPIGAPFSIKGAGFGPYAGANTRVTIGGVAAPLSVWNDTTITGTVPGAASAGAATLLVERLVAGGGYSASTPHAFEVLVPRIDTMTPDGGQGGTAFTLAGAGFGPYAGSASRVLFGGTPAALSLWNDTAIRGVVPSALAVGTYTVVVERTPSGGTVRSNEVLFTLGAPVGGAALRLSPETAEPVRPDWHYEARLALPAAEGGRIETPARAAVELPANALDEEKELTIAKAAASGSQNGVRASAQAREGIAPAGPAIEFGPEGTEFKAPVIIELPYSPKDLAAGQSEDGVAVHYWDPTAKAWVALLSEVDKARRTVRARTTHFSLYQPMAAAPRVSAASESFALREVYVFPNPARAGAKPTFHVEVGPADTLAIRVYDVSGALVHEHEMTGPPGVVDDGAGPEYAFEYVWEGRIPSGVYFYAVEAKKAGQGSLRKTGKLGVVR